MVVLVHVWTFTHTVLPHGVALKVYIQLCRARGALAALRCCAA